MGHRSLSSTQVYTHLREREVAEHTSEHLDTFFRLNEKSVDSNINVQIILGTEHEYDGGDIDKAEKRAAFIFHLNNFTQPYQISDNSQKVSWQSLDFFSILVIKLLSL